MKISVGSDHGGVNLKEQIVAYLDTLGHEVIDKGTFTKDSVDYPDFAVLVAKDVGAKVSHRGILVCGSGAGVTIVANKVNGVRAVNCYNEEITRLSRAHNDANVLCLGERFIDLDIAKKIVNIWLKEEFEGERHQFRINKITELENEQNN